MPRPPRYTAELAERVLHQLRAGRSLRRLCNEPGMPSASTVLNWVNDDHHGFAAAYRRARETGNAIVGRASGYSAETAERILEELRRGRTLIHVCRDHGMPSYGTVRDWVTNERHGFAAPYREALRAGGTRWARPTRYARVIAEAILDKLGEGRALESICADPGMPTAAAVRLWVTQDRDGFAARYWTMREIGCEMLADRLIASADDRRGMLKARVRKDGTIEWVVDRDQFRRVRLRCDVYRWLLSRRLRDTYGSRNAKRDRGDPSTR
jgi:transposase-like protein